MNGLGENKGCVEAWSPEDELESQQALHDLLADTDGAGGGRPTLSAIVRETMDAIFAALDGSEDGTLRSMMIAAGVRDMDGAALREADLRGQNLSGISFAGADFSAADLRNCNFAGCDLRGAKFESAMLAGADFSEARVDPAVLAGAMAAQIEAEEWTKFGILSLIAGAVWGVRAMGSERGDAETARDETAESGEGGDLAEAEPLEAAAAGTAIHRASS